jgi:hypothetical protein
MEVFIVLFPCCGRLATRQKLQVPRRNANAKHALWNNRMHGVSDAASDIRRWKTTGLAADVVGARAARRALRRGNRERRP